MTRSGAVRGVRHRDELHGLSCDFMYTIDDLDAENRLGVPAMRMMDRFSQLAGLDTAVWDTDRVAAVIGSAHGGLPFYDEQSAVLAEKGARRVSPKLAPMTTVNSAAGSVCMDLGARGPSLSLSTASMPRQTLCHPAGAPSAGRSSRVQHLGPPPDARNSERSTGIGS